jgi:very-short-patch-repair endonuclease
MNPKLIPFARQLRKNSTKEERILWKRIRGRQFEGFKFRRQHPIESFIVDFVCIEKGLVIELDGGHHGFDEDRKYDAERDGKLRAAGYKILRFQNRDVKMNLDGVAVTIWNTLKK